jgi:putative transposase
MQRFGCSQRQALRVVRMSASTYLYVSQRKDESALKSRIKEITDTRVHYGYRRVHVLLRREGHMDNVKRVYRLYREEGLSLRLKRPRRNKAAQRRQPKQLAHAINQIWSMDFVADALFDGRKLRMLTVVDLFSRECLAIDVGQSLKGEDVVRVLTAITQERGLPQTIKSDNGSEFISKVMDRWAYERGRKSEFGSTSVGPASPPTTPT